MAGPGGVGDTSMLVEAGAGLVFVTFDKGTTGEPSLSDASKAVRQAACAL